MQIANREMFAAATRKRLPYDAEVEYLEVGDSLCKIDTGVPGALSGLKIETKCYYSTWPAAYKAVFSNYVNESSNAVRLILRESDNGGAYAAADTAANYAMVVTNFSKGYWHIVTVDASLHAITVDGVTYYATRQGAANNTNIALFSAKVSAGTSFTSARMAYFRAYQGDAIIRDLVPVRFTNEQGQSEGAMYDRVLGRLFRNVGTGSFTIGPDVN